MLHNKWVLLALFCLAVAIFIVWQSVLAVDELERDQKEDAPEPSDEDIRALAQQLYEDRMRFARTDKTLAEQDWRIARDMLKAKALYPNEWRDDL